VIPLESGINVIALLFIVDIGYKGPNVKALCVRTIKPGTSGHHRIVHPD
jgi:hypothetical protein